MLEYQSKYERKNRIQSVLLDIQTMSIGGLVVNICRHGIFSDVQPFWLDHGDNALVIFALIKYYIQVEHNAPHQTNDVEY